MPSAVRSKRTENGSTATPGRRADQTLRMGPCSISSLPPITVSPVQPMRTLVPVASQIREASWPKPSAWACDTKRNEKSGSALPSAARISSVTERMASERLVARE